DRLRVVHEPARQRIAEMPRHHHLDLVPPAIQVDRPTRLRPPGQEDRPARLRITSPHRPPQLLQRPESTFAGDAVAVAPLVVSQEDDTEVVPNELVTLVAVRHQATIPNMRPRPSATRAASSFACRVVCQSSRPRTSI